MMADKRHSENKPTSAVKKRRTITLEEKMNIVKRHETGQSISHISRTLGMAMSTINTIVKDKERIKEHVKGSAPMKSTIITKQRSDVLYEMEKLLLVWIEEQNERRIPLSLATIQEKAKTLYAQLKEKKGETKGTFVASHGWFNRFRNRANLHKMKTNGEAASADTVTAEEFPNMFCEIVVNENNLEDEVDYASQTRQTVERPQNMESQNKPFPKQNIKCGNNKKSEMVAEHAKETLVCVLCKTLNSSSRNVDEFDHFGVNVACKLREMDRHQRIYAEKLISEVIFHGQLGQLTADTLQVKSAST